jgi:hypothetical protein
MPKFQIPEDLTPFTFNAIEAMKKQAESEFSTIMAEATPETVTDEQLDDASQLQEFIRDTVPTHLADRKRRREQFSALNTAPEGDEDGDGDEGGEDGDSVTDGAPTAVTASSVINVTLADIVSNSPVATPIFEDTRPRYSSLVAAAGVPNFEAGQEFPTLLDVAKAFLDRSAGFSGSRAPTVAGPVHYPVAVMRREYPAEFSVNGDESDYAKLLAVSDESRLPGGSLLRSVEARRQQIEAQHPGRDSLVAAQGWCAPSETDYDICLQITTDGMYDAPEVQARRGGIRHNTGIEFDTIFGSGTGFFDLTEAQVAAGTTKTCLEIPCPDFVDTRLGVTGLCLTGNILANRGYPEFTATFVRGALAASAHQINREQIADVVSGSTAVNLTAVAPWATDGSTVSQVLSAVEMAIVDIKYRLRMMKSATLEVVMPFWILAQMRADWIRRNGGDYSDMLCLADSAISSAFSCRGARVQFVYDWQDAFATGAASGSPGADTPINNLPCSLSFLVYPAGTWVRAVADVITLNSVYDSTKLATNQVTHLFTETGWAMLKMCPVSRVYTVPVCPSGKTTSTGSLTCPTCA